MGTWECCGLVPPRLTPPLRCVRRQTRRNEDGATAVGPLAEFLREVVAREHGFGRKSRASASLWHSPC